jgi:anti-sigma28 factor (negative regulator of flagellin synthesis)
MKITDIKAVLGPDRIKPQEPAAPPASSSGTVPTGSEPRDRVTVGASTARPADSAVAVAAARRGAGAERSARLDRLGAQVRSGSYAPDPSRVAEQILSDAEIDARLQAMVSR